MTAPDDVRREAGLLHDAEVIRDAVQRSKLTAADPWSYTPRARVWWQRAQALVERIAREGETAESRRELERLLAEVEGDPDFQEARRRF
jgi:hypothetical protein